MEVFISYSHVNKNLARKLAKELSRIGVTYFLDEKDITWGKPLDRTVKIALDQCYAVVVIVSHASLQSAWVPYEVGHVLGSNTMGASKMVLPILTDPTLNVPGYLAEYKWISNINQAIAFFKSQRWKSHCQVSRKVRCSNLTILRNEIKLLNELLDLYMPGAREPEDL